MQFYNQQQIKETTFEILRLNSFAFLAPINELKFVFKMDKELDLQISGRVFKKIL